MEISATPKPLLDLLENQLKICPDDLQLILYNFHEQKVEKKDFLVRQGEIVQMKGFLKEGAMRIYYLDSNAKENILFFRFEGSWLGDMESYHLAQPSKIFIQALEDCSVLTISKKDFEILEIKVPQLQKWYSVNMLRMYTSLFNKLMEAKMRTPEEKYQHLIQQYPEIFQRVSLQHIAAYLEIEPQSLSRLRKRIKLKQQKFNQG